MEEAEATVTIPQDWMPPGMSDEDKDAYAALYPSDPYRAAGEAWQAWAATLPAEASATSVSTGDQSVTYADGSTQFDQAMSRARWFLSRAKVRSVQVDGPVVDIGYGIDPDDFDGGVIETVDVGP